MVSHSSLSLYNLFTLPTHIASAYFTIVDSFINIKSIIIIYVIEMVTGRDNNTQKIKFDICKKIKWIIFLWNLFK